MNPIFSTNRFDVYEHHIVRNKKLGGAARDVFTAWYKDVDIPRPVCVITLFGRYVEWVETVQHYRRRGIATEVLSRLERHFGNLRMDAATEDGRGFLDNYNKR